MRLFINNEFPYYLWRKTKKSRTTAANAQLFFLEFEAQKLFVTDDDKIGSFTSKDLTANREL